MDIVLIVKKVEEETALNIGPFVHLMNIVNYNDPQLCVNLVN